MDDRDTEFTEYFASRASTMRATAFLLCGDWHRAEDLVQTAFVKLYRAWPRVNRQRTLDAYTRQIVVRTFLDEARRGFYFRERATGEPVDRAVPADGSVEDRVVLTRALDRVAPRQRAALVLRFYADLSVEETARAMGCSAGTVKSQTAKGLDVLRDVVLTAVR